MAKKNFKTNNPALQFISSAPESEPQEAADAVPVRKSTAGYKVNPFYVETKSKRLQLVVQPSLYDRVKAAAEENGLSVNEFIHRTLDEATKE